MTRNPDFGRRQLRSFKFVLANGIWSVFTGYVDSLDYLVNYAWEEVAKVQMGEYELTHGLWGK